MIPFIDAKGGGSAKGYLTAIDKVISRIPPDTTVIPGHGEVTNINGLKTARKFIQDLNDAAAKAKAAGKSKEAFVQEINLPEYKEWNGYDTRLKEAPCGLRRSEINRNSTARATSATKVQIERGAGAPPAGHTRQQLRDWRARRPHHVSNTNHVCVYRCRPSCKHVMMAIP